MRSKAEQQLHALLDRGEDPERAARAALKLSDECVEAWLVLADCAVSPQEARDRVRKAVEAATKGVGADGLRDGRGTLGDTPEGAAYLHALAALARVQLVEDRGVQAIQTLEGVLAMDPRDPVQVRGDLLLLLLATGRDDEAEELVSSYPEEASAEWMLGRALVRRRRVMDEDGLARATAALDRAVTRFPSEARELAGVERDAGAKRPPRVDPILRQAFDDTDGARDWLGARVAAFDAMATPAPSPPDARATAEADRRFTAREHVEEAWEAEGGRRESLARRALELWPDAAEAWRALATVSPTPAERVRRLTEAVDAGRRALGRAAAETAPLDASDEARALLRARADLASARRETGDVEGAFAEERRLLADDPDDPLGVGVGHVAALLALDRDAEAAGLLAKREEDAAPGWVWLRVLARRRAGDRIATSFALGEATMVAPFVGPLLLAGGVRVPVPEGLSSDAVLQARRAADALRPAWAATPGALEWLRERLPRPPDRSRPGPGHGRRDGRRR